jgi:hypothetical protein
MGDRFEADRELWEGGVAIHVSCVAGIAWRVAATTTAGLARVARVDVDVRKNAHEPRAALGRTALRPRFRHAPAV